MAYEKTTWQSGDVVTSEKLNNIENGIASRDVLICDITEGNTLNQKAGDVWNAYLNGRAVLLRTPDRLDPNATNLFSLFCAENTSGGIMVYFFNPDAPFKFFAETADDYLEYQQD